MSVANYNAAVREQLARHVGDIVDVECLAAGPTFVDSVAAEQEAAVHVRARLATLEGYDGVLVDCFGDPGVGEYAVPVVGAFEPAMLAANALGQPISIILPNTELADHIQDRIVAAGWTATTYGLDDADLGQLVQDIANAPRRQTIVLGCTAWASRAAELEVDADVIEPEATAIRYLVELIDRRRAAS